MRVGLTVVVTWVIVLILFSLYQDAKVGMSQSSFPCLEDQVLGYSPQFGPDRVGCLNIEEVK